MTTSTASRSSYGEATALGSVFILALGALLFLYWRFLRGKRQFTVVTGQGYSTLRVKLGKWRYVALAGCLFYIAVMTVLPLIFLIIGSFMRRYGFFNINSPFTLAHWRDLLTDPIFLLSLKNSLIIASITAAGGIVLYSTVAYLLVSRRTVAAPLLEGSLLVAAYSAGHTPWARRFSGCFSPRRCAFYFTARFGASLWRSW